MGRRRTGRREHVGAVVVGAARDESISLGSLSLAITVLNG
jgi:hypothetical protein